MAPSVNLADDAAEQSRAIGQLARLQLAGRSLSQLAPAAAAAGMSAEQAGAFMRGEILLPPRQTVSFVNAVLEQARISQVSYMTQLRQGHAGSDLARGSYAARASETVTRHGRSETHEWVTGGPVETTRGDVDATLARLGKDFPGWRFEVDGVESLADGRAKLVWLARHAEHGRVDGATSLELAAGILRPEAEARAEEDKWARAIDGRGVVTR
jgi:hypothetical protein